MLVMNKMSEDLRTYLQQNHHKFSWTERINISSGQPPYINHEHNYELAMKIVNGMRPKIVPGTPSEYRKLMELCWDADLTKRPDALTLEIEMRELRRLYIQNNEQTISDQESS